MGLVHHPNVVTDGLVGCWDAGNRRSYPGTGTTWTDLAGGSVGTLTNTGGDGPTFNSANGGSIDFDGTNDYAEVYAITGAMLESIWTASFWVQLDETNSGQDTIFANGQAVNGEGLHFVIFNDVFRFDLWNYASNGSTTVSVGTWYNVVFQFNASYDRKIYVNGEAETMSTSSANVAYTSALDNSNLGRRLQDTSSYFPGKIANFLFYNRLLTAAEVKQNYEATKPRFEPRIAKRGMNLNFDAGDPASYAGGTTTWKDTANGLTTTFHNMDATNFNSSNGGYFDFDGTDEYMSVLNSPLFQGAIADQGTFAAWFNIDAAETLSRDAPIWGAGRNASGMTWSMAQYHSSKKMHLYVNLGGSWSLGGDTDTALSYDTWYYVVFTWDKANTQVKSYVNGALDDTETTSSVSITTSTTGWLGIGASLYSVSNGGTPNDYLNGFIGVLQLYDSVLSAAEVMDNFQKTRGRFGV